MRLDSDGNNAIDTGDRQAPTSTDRPKVEAIDEKIASLLGIEAKQLAVNDLAVNPISGTTYLSLSRGRGPDAIPVLVRVKSDTQLEVVSLDKIRFSRAERLRRSWWRSRPRPTSEATPPSPHGGCGKL